MGRTLGLQDIQKRHSVWWKRWLDKKSVQRLDKIMLVVAIAYPFTMLPQIMKLYELGDASSISILTFILKILLCFPWLLYGYVHNNRPIFYSNILWAIGYIVVVFQALTY